MAWVVDTCVVLDVLDDDPDFGAASAQCLQDHLAEGLVVSPVSCVELAPAFLGDARRLDDFLRKAGLDAVRTWTEADTLRAFRAWHEHIEGRRGKRVARRPVADILIGAFAERVGGLITRNPDDFVHAFPDLTVVVPGGEG